MRKAKRFVRGRRFLTAALLTVVVVGLGLFAGRSFTASAVTSTINGDASCGYSSTTAFPFTESTVIDWAQVNGNGLDSATFSAYANDENSILLGVNGATGMSGGGVTVPQHIGSGTGGNGADANGGDPSQVLPDHQPYYPSLYLTKMSGPPALSGGGFWTTPGQAIPQEPGDFQQGGSSRNISGLVTNNSTLSAGTPYVNDVFGTWVTGNVVGPNDGHVGTLTGTLSTTANNTSLPVAGGTTQAIKANDTITLVQGSHTQANFKASANVAAGALSIPISGQKSTTPAFTSGATIIDTKLVSTTNTFTRSALPTKNNNVYGANSDAPTDPGGASALHNEGYGTEFRWNIKGLSAFDQSLNGGSGGYAALAPGTWYKVQIVDNDGDQNHSGGDTGEFCTMIRVPGPPPIHTDPTGGNSITGANVDGAIKQWVGSTIKDTAFVSANSGFGIPTGSVTFNLYFDSGNAPTTCANPTDTPPGNLVYTDTETLDSSNDPALATSGVTTPGYDTTGHGLGTYYWQDTFTPSGTNAANYTTVTEACGSETDQMVDARIRLTPHSAFNIVGNTHTIHAIAETKAAGDAGWTAQGGEEIDTSLNSGTNAVYNGASSTANPEGSCVTATHAALPAPDASVTKYCDVTITDDTAEDVVITATSDISLTGVTGGINGDDSITEGTNNDASCLADDVSGVANGNLCEAIKHYINPTTTLHVTDTMVGLTGNVGGSVTYTAYGTLSACMAGTGGTDETVANSNPFNGATAPLSQSVDVPDGTAVWFTATYSGNLGSFTSDCTEKASSG